MQTLDAKKLLDLIKKISSARVLVFGDVILDEFIWGSARRISPEAPVPVVNVIRETKRLGGAANVAANLVGLGAGVSIVGPVGDDENAAYLKQLLDDRGIDSSGLVADPERPTPIKTRVIAGHQQIVRYDREKSATLSGAASGAAIDFISAEINNYDAIIISDYGKGAVSSEIISQIVKLAHDGGKIVSVDPKVENFKFYRNVDLITPNTLEAATSLSIAIENDADVERAGTMILDQLKCRMALITRGEHGMSLFRAGEAASVGIETAAREVFDVTGAGDTVIAVMTAALAAGAEPVISARLANLAAGIVVGELGTAPIETAKLVSLINQTHHEN